MSDIEKKGDNGLLPLRRYTDARIALGATGISIPLAESLDFKLAHAHARDAVYSSLDLNSLMVGLERFNLPVIHVGSQARARQEYLQRPDLGRKLDETSKTQLLAETESDIVIILADGLSASAINDHALILLDLLIASLRDVKFKLGPIVLVDQGRVAIADEIGALLKARSSLILIGERPGLSSPNSMGAYFTYQPAVGLTDESRNCVSNIRPEGLPYSAASRKILYLIMESFKRKLSGIHLKEDSSLLK